VSSVTIKSQMHMSVQIALLSFASHVSSNGS